jgi:hypothetical protein
VVGLHLKVLSNKGHRADFGRARDAARRAVSAPRSRRRRQGQFG